MGITNIVRKVISKGKSLRSKREPTEKERQDAYRQYLREITRPYRGRKLER